MSAVGPPCVGIGFRAATPRSPARAARRSIGDGVLVAHALGQAQHVFQRLGRGSVVPHAGAADGRAACGRVHCNNSLQAGFLVKEGVNAFMVRERGRFKQRRAHDRPFLGIFCAHGHTRPSPKRQARPYIGARLQRPLRISPVISVISANEGAVSSRPSAPASPSQSAP